MISAIFCLLILAVMCWPAVMWGMARIVVSLAYTPDPTIQVMPARSRAYSTQYKIVENNA